jgi:hypothetical protein
MTTSNPPVNGDESVGVAKQEPKMVHVKMHIQGDRRKGKIWLAKVNGLDQKYGLAREFLNGDRTYYGKHDLSIYYEFDAPEGTILQSSESGSWSNSYGYFYVVKEGVTYDNGDQGYDVFVGNRNNEGMPEIKEHFRNQQH